MNNSTKTILKTLAKEIALELVLLIGKRLIETGNALKNREVKESNGTTVPLSPEEVAKFENLVKKATQAPVMEVRKDTDASL
jgi:hypothetical protein